MTALNFFSSQNLFSTTVAVEDDAIIWIIKNQFGRRNLSAYDRSLLALKLKPVIAAKAKENQIRKPAESVPKNSWEQTEQLPQLGKRKENRQNETAYQVSKAAGVSEDTIRKVEKIEQKATPEIKAALKAGDMQQEEHRR